jgi:DNA repair exonuclease SbcCD ATPase subunit
LFAHITQKLMESTSQEASRILESLGWHIGISYDEKDGFCITDQALSAIRKYLEFSGGERFAIAIAVALAIGRVTHGAGNIRCLFIDEGFGALDQGHRKRIINDAIGKLIEIGSRDQVVVITHLKDMQAHFPNRVELKREGDHSALVSPIEDVLE